MGYVWVEDVDAAVTRLTAAGGKVYKPSSDIPGVGRFAVVADPTAGVHAVPRRRRESAAAPPPDTPGLVGWHELHADDGEGARFLL